MSARRSVLIFEYLLASPGAWRDASPSMRREAVSMLGALVRDFARLPDVDPVVLVACDAREIVTSNTHFAAPVEVLWLEVNPADWLARPDRDPRTFAATMVIAPECGGTLVSLLRQLQTGRWQDVQNLNVRWPLAEIFTDKFKTFQWLQQHGFPTPRTQTISVAEHDELKALKGCQSLFVDNQSMPQNPSLGILKPRDGVGCEDVSFIQLAGDEFFAEERSVSDDHPWLFQHYVPGFACSVGLIGGQNSGPATILPPAAQNLRLQNGHVAYCGGSIPCDLNLQSGILSLANLLVPALGAFAGYLGIDLVVQLDPSGTSLATIIEINPRLCTSYVGYRRATNDNLAELILRGRNENAILWRAEVIHFDVDGQNLLPTS